MTGQDSSNRLQGRATGPAALTPRVRREMETRANVFAEDDSVVVTPTARGTAIRANIPNDVVASMVWDADTKIATVNFDYRLILPTGTTRRLDSHDYQSTLDDGGVILENATAHSLQGKYKIDLSGVPAAQYGTISFYIANYHTDLNGNQAWGVPNFDSGPLILVDNYTDGTGIVATRTYTVDGVETVDEPVSVRHKNSHTLFGEHALEAYRNGRDAFSTGHHYLCSMVTDIELIAGTPVNSWLFGHHGKTRTIQRDYLGFTWNPSTLTLSIGQGHSYNWSLISRLFPTRPAIPDIVDAYTFSAPNATTTNPPGISVGLYYDDAAGTLKIGVVPNQSAPHINLVNFELVDGEITHIKEGANYEWHPGIVGKGTTNGTSMRAYTLAHVHLNDAGNRQLSSLTFDGNSGRLYFVEEDEDTTTPDETVDVFANNGDRLRLTMIGDDLYTVASRTPATASVGLTLDEDGGGTLNVNVYNTGVMIPVTSSSMSFI